MIEVAAPPPEFSLSREEQMVATSTSRAEQSLQLRNALDDVSHIRSRLALSGADTGTPLVTIAIITYRRRELLIEAVESAVHQSFGGPFEVIVVDDDPESKDYEFVAERCADVLTHNFRYYVHEQNMGQFSSHNRAITLARGEWVSILHDDDLLDRDWLAKMVAVVERNPDIHGIGSRKRTVHISGTEVKKSPLFVRFARQALTTLMFSGRESRRFAADKFFWGALFGNVAGFLFKREVAVRIGGFYPEDGTIADSNFLVRFAKHAHLRQHRDIAATYRVADNLSAKPDTVRENLFRYQLLQRHMIGDVVPNWWNHFLPRVISHHVVENRVNWGVDVPLDEVEGLVGKSLPRHRPYLLWAIRAALRGF